LLIDERFKKAKGGREGCSSISPRPIGQGGAEEDADKHRQGEILSEGVAHSLAGQNAGEQLDVRRIVFFEAARVADLKVPVGADAVAPALPSIP